MLNVPEVGINSLRSDSDNKVVRVVRDKRGRKQLLALRDRDNSLGLCELELVRLFRSRMQPFGLINLLGCMQPKGLINLKGCMVFKSLRIIVFLSNTQQLIVRLPVIQPILVESFH